MFNSRHTHNFSLKKYLEGCLSLQISFFPFHQRWAGDTMRPARTRDGCRRAGAGAGDDRRTHSPTQHHQHLCHWILHAACALHTITLALHVRPPRRRAHAAAETDAGKEPLASDQSTETEACALYWLMPARLNLSKSLCHLCRLRWELSRASWPPHRLLCWPPPQRRRRPGAQDNHGLDQQRHQPHRIHVGTRLCII